MADRYEPSTFEAKWQQRWKDADLYRTREVEGAPKFYGMDFFPYPSGAGLSVGHCRNYVPTDVICRMKRMQGYNVLHPMGFDAFGLPAENEAIKRQTHPAPMIERYAQRYREQMDLVAVSYDWSRSFKSSDPDYYRWTQWIFELLFKRGLAYQKLAAVNWDPIDKTVLADEEVVGGRAERSGALVEKKWIPQWFFRITEYAQRLLDDLDPIDWPEGIKAQQRNWIGRSEGVQFRMRVAGEGETDRYDLDTDTDPAKPLEFEVFTTRIDTIFGMTFCVLAPELPLIEDLKRFVSAQDILRIEAYQAESRSVSEMDRQAEGREKTGVFTGAYAVNPANGRNVPIWIADYVLATYGTGAIMAVPAHDVRDYEFARKFGLEVIPVISPAVEELPELPFIAKDGVMINSGVYSGKSVAEASSRLGEWVEQTEIGTRKVQFKLRDWLISRQRYWGCPIPVIHSRDGELQLVPESELPVLLPDVENYEPSGDGTSPLARIEDFVRVTDLDGRLGKRETDTMGGFACSSWYFLRFTDPHNPERAWSPAAANYWMPVDCYVGGAEHAVMHLLYARFWTKVLHDAGLVGVNEPFRRLENQGQVLGPTPYRRPRVDERLAVGEEGILISAEEAKELPLEDVEWRWTRMSKSKGNVVTPEEAVTEYGADALRLYLLFVAPFSADVQWSNEGMAGQSRFLSRIFRWVADRNHEYVADWAEAIPFADEGEIGKRIRRLTHQTIKNVTDDIDRFSFNTYVSWLMKYVNGLNDLSDSGEAPLAVSEAIETLVLLLGPGAPHSSDELWEGLGKSGFTLNRAWPRFDPALAVEDTVMIAVQVNGKLRDTFEAAAGLGQDELAAAARGRLKVQVFIGGLEVRKVVVVPGKLVNIVVG